MILFVIMPIIIGRRGHISLQIHDKGVLGAYKIDREDSFGDRCKDR
ncbi:hypothetical protein M1N10_04115 [Thermodesulfovibrionales bacterium]|nr:hypothetical protein [Thermodesulfovibrionales bacterium]